MHLRTAIITIELHYIDTLCAFGYFPPALHGARVATTSASPVRGTLPNGHPNEGVAVRATVCGVVPVLASSVLERVRQTMRDTQSSPIPPRALYVYHLSSPTPAAEFDNVLPTADAPGCAVLDGRWALFVTEHADGDTQPR